MSADTHAFADTVVVVTGGGSGIGLATVGEFLAAGAKVAVIDVDVSRVLDHPDCAAFVADIRSASRLDEVITAVIDRWGRLDVLVNAVGIEFVATVAETTEDSWHRVMDTNVTGYFLAVRRALPEIIRSRGTIVNVASQLALVGAGSFAAYTASKAAIVGFTRSLAIEVAEYGVRANAVCPGAVDTPLLQRQFADGREGPQGSMADLIAMHPLGRLGTAIEIARSVLFLAGPDSTFITGSALVVDGGYTAR